MNKALKKRIDFFVRFLKEHGIYKKYTFYYRRKYHKPFTRKNLINQFDLRVINMGYLLGIVDWTISEEGYDFWSELSIMLDTCYLTHLQGGKVRYGRCY